jgi:hypothetical protein
LRLFLQRMSLRLRALTGSCENDICIYHETDRNEQPERVSTRHGNLGGDFATYLETIASPCRTIVRQSVAEAAVGKRILHG